MGFCCQEDRPTAKEKQDHKEKKEKSKLKRKKTKKNADDPEREDVENKYDDKNSQFASDKSFLDSFNTPLKPARIEDDEIQPDGTVQINIEDTFEELDSSFLDPRRDKTPGKDKNKGQKGD